MCDVQGCDQPAEFYDEVGKELCYDCMDKEIQEEGTSSEEYDEIAAVKRAIKGQMSERKPEPEKRKVQKFLLANGWELDDETYNKESCISVDLSEGDMVFLSDSGDFLHEKMNLYTLIGVFMQYRQLPFNYKQYSDHTVKIVNRNTAGSTTNDMDTFRNSNQNSEDRRKRNFV